MDLSVPMKLMLSLRVIEIKKFIFLVGAGDFLADHLVHIFRRDAGTRP